MTFLLLRVGATSTVREGKCKIIMPGIYRDRTHAGEVLASSIKYEENLLVLAIPNGGIPAALPVIEKLHAQFDMCIVRKLQIPFNPEAGFGAVNLDGDIILNEELLLRLHLSEREIERSIKRAEHVLNRRNEELRKSRPFPDIQSHTIILIDDGLASGYTMMAAVQYIRKRKPVEMIVAVPTAHERAVSWLQKRGVSILCPDIQGGAVFAVANAYRNWYDVSNARAEILLKKIGYS
jgi:putative phosphoribosyl transferase